MHKNNIVMSFQASQHNDEIWLLDVKIEGFIQKLQRGIHSEQQLVTENIPKWRNYKLWWSNHKTMLWSTYNMIISTLQIQKWESLGEHGSLYELKDMKSKRVFLLSYLIRAVSDNTAEVWTITNFVPPIHTYLVSWTGGVNCFFKTI